MRNRMNGSERTKRWQRLQPLHLGPRILSLLLLLLPLLLLPAGCGTSAEDSRITLSRIGRGDIESVIAVNGQLESRNVTDIYFPANYRIQEVLVKRYQWVEAGDRLAEITPNTAAATVDPAIVENALTCPISGYVSVVNAKNNAITTAAGVMFQITDVRDLYIRSSIRQGDLKYLSAGMPVSVRSDAYPSLGVMEGVLDLIVPFARSSATTSAEDVIIDIGIAFTPAGDVLRPGYTVSCEIQTARKDDVLLLPLESLMEDKNRAASVFVYDPDQGKIYRRGISLGVMSDFVAEITSGLEEGEQVVMNPRPAYTDGMRVRVKNP